MNGSKEDRGMLRPVANKLAEYIAEAFEDYGVNVTPVREPGAEPGGSRWSGQTGVNPRITVDFELYFIFNKNNDDDDLDGEEANKKDTPIFENFIRDVATNFFTISYPRIYPIPGRCIKTIYRVSCHTYKGYTNYGALSNDNNFWSVSIGAYESFDGTKAKDPGKTFEDVAKAIGKFKPITEESFWLIDRYPEGASWAKRKNLGSKEFKVPAKYARDTLSNTASFKYWDYFKEPITGYKLGVNRGWHGLVEMAAEYIPNPDIMLVWHNENHRACLMRKKDFNKMIKEAKAYMKENNWD